MGTPNIRKLVGGEITVTVMSSSDYYSSAASSKSTSLYSLQYQACINGSLSVTGGVVVLCTAFHSQQQCIQEWIKTKQWFKPMVQPIPCSILGRMWCLDTQKNRQHIKFAKNSTHMAVCYLLSSNGMFSNLHGNLPMKLFKSFQVIASIFSTPIFTDWPDSLSRLQLLQTVWKFYQQDVWDCSSLVPLAKYSQPVPWIYRLLCSFEFARPNCSASY